MAWGCMQPPEGLKFIQKISEYKAQPARRGKMSSFLVRRQLPICLL